MITFYLHKYFSYMGEYLLCELGVRIVELLQTAGWHAGVYHRRVDCCISTFHSALTQSFFPEIGR